MKCGYLGIDTSNYTTSVCAIDADGRIVFEERKLLDVALGERGLMQSHALFQHVQRLPGLLAAWQTACPDMQLAGVAVSERPRNLPDSYMPVFQVGLLAASAVAAGAQVPLIRTDHQSGHIEAGIATTGFEPRENVPFLVLHLSGGTTDVLRVQMIDGTYHSELLASSQDLHVGQFVDRIGVLMGLPFPAGPHLETLAAQANDDGSLFIPSAVHEGQPSFSGPLSAAERAWALGLPKERIAFAVQRCIATTLEKMIRHWRTVAHTQMELLVGGVASNRAIQQRLYHRFGMSADGNASGPIFFCDPKYASDNAYGVARIARRRLLR